jgi:Tfp pilus assembly protein PilO
MQLKGRVVDMAANSGASKKYLVIILAILVVILSFTLVYIQNTTLANLRVEVEMEEQALSIAQANLARLMNLRANAAEYEQRLVYAERMIPADAGEEAILRYFYRLSDEYDIKVVEIRFDNRSVGETFNTMPLVLNLEGNYSNLSRLLRRLRDGDRVFRVNNIQISRTGGSGSDLRLTLAASAFYKTVE